MCRLSMQFGAERGQRCMPGVYSYRASILHPTLVVGWVVLRAGGHYALLPWILQWNLDNVVNLDVCTSSGFFF